MIATYPCILFVEQDCCSQNILYLDMPFLVEVPSDKQVYFYQVACHKRRGVCFFQPMIDILRTKIKRATANALTSQVDEGQFSEILPCRRPYELIPDEKTLLQLYVHKDLYRSAVAYALLQRSAAGADSG